MRRLAMPLVLAMLASTGCGLFTSTGQPPPPPPERTSLRVGVGSAIDTAPLRIAVANGLFSRAGLRVDLVEQGAQDGPAELAAGRLDVAFGSDATWFRAAAGGASLELEGEAYTAGSDTIALVTLPGSHYTDLSARKSPTIAVDAPDDLGGLAARSVLGTAGIDPAAIRFRRTALGDMAAALQDGDADAALMVEPYLTRAQKELGARIVADGASGATLDFPVSSYASSGAFAQANPRTLALFRGLLGQAQQQAADPTVVRQALPRFSDIDPTTASIIALGAYPTSLNGVRLQRVADLMHSYGLLAARLDVQAMLPKTGTG